MRPVRESELEYRPGRHLVKYKHVNSGFLERWVGAENLALVSERMRGWHGPPIAMANVPGHVYACGDGDFAGKILGGKEANIEQWMLDDLRRLKTRRDVRFARLSKQMGGFSSLSDLISEATTGGKKQVLNYHKLGVAAPSAGASQWLWRLGTNPGIAAVAASAPGGTVYTNATIGSLAQANADFGDTLHFVSWTGTMTQGQTTALMLCDNLWAANFNYATSGDVTVTGVPTRYQTPTTAPGNFMSGDVTTVLGATAQNVTITYVDQDGNIAEVSAALAIRASSAVNTIPHTQPVWNIPLNSGDTGLRNITIFNLSAANSGFVDRMIAHPIAILPHVGAANSAVILDGINSAFNLERIYDNAALGLMQWFSSAVTGSNYGGYITLCSG